MERIEERTVILLLILAKQERNLLYTLCLKASKRKPNPGPSLRVFTLKSAESEMFPLKMIIEFLKKLSK